MTAPFHRSHRCGRSDFGETTPNTDTDIWRKLLRDPRRYCNISQKIVDWAPTAIIFHYICSICRICFIHLWIYWCLLLVGKIGCWKLKNWLNILVAASQVMQPFWENTFPANNRAVKGIKTPKETGSEMAGGDGRRRRQEEQQKVATALWAST